MVRVIREDGPGKAKLQFMLKNLSGKTGRVGWFETAKYPDGTPVATVAAIQEFGAPTKNIPPRSFMRTTMREKRDAWRELAASGARAIANGNATIGIVMEGIGLQAQGDIAKKISEITSPPLKPATVKARMSKMADGKTTGNLTKPLIDTGLMFATIHHDVVNAGAE